MAEQLAVEVDVKNVTEQQQQYTAAAAAGQAHLFCLDNYGNVGYSPLDDIYSSFILKLSFLFQNQAVPGP